MFIVAADIHFRFLTFSTCPGAKFDSLTAFKKLVQKTKEMENRLLCQIPIVICGDIWDSTKVHPEILKKVQDILTEYKVKLYYINGNHDAVIPSWTEFLPDSVHVGKEVVTLPDGTRLVGLDYVHPKRVKDELEDYPNDVDFLMTHQFIERDTNSMISASVPVESYYRFKTVLAGDIHTPGDVMNNETYVSYPGCLSRCTIREPESCYMIVSKEPIPEIGGFTQFNNGYWYSRKTLDVRKLITAVYDGSPDFYSKERLTSLVNGETEPYIVFFSDYFKDYEIKQVQEALQGIAHPLFRRRISDTVSESIDTQEQQYESNACSKDYAIEVLCNLDMDREVRQLAEAAIEDTDKFLEDLKETFNIKED